MITRIDAAVRPHPALALVLGLALAAYGGSPGTNQAPATDTATVDNGSAPLPNVSTPISPDPATPKLTAAAPADGPLACSAEIGRAAAEALARQCRRVSPATHPPCNAANSCAMIRDEVARGCALLGDAAASTGDCPTPPSDAAAAVDAVRRYYAAIDARDYGTAYAQWADRGAASGKSRRAFEQGFAQTRRTHVNVGRPGRVEGAAGSLYVAVPVTVDAMLDNSTRQHFTGTYVLRQVNGPDSPAPPRGWHIQSATLKRAG